MNCEKVTREIKEIDSKLFCKEVMGRNLILRENYRYERFDLDNGNVLVAPILTPDYVLALTDNWSAKGKPADWSIDNIKNRLWLIDSQNPHSIVNNIEKQHAKVDESKKKNLENKTEDFVKDFRPQFAKAFNDFNTSTVTKEDRRKKDERKFKNGNRK